MHHQEHGEDEHEAAAVQQMQGLRLGQGSGDPGHTGDGTEQELERIDVDQHQEDQDRVQDHHEQIRDAVALKKQVVPAGC